MKKAYRITGIVQGVGFRPFVYRLARELSLSGWVLNDSQGVLTLVQGAAEAIEAFRHRLTDDAPPMAVINEIIDLSIREFLTKNPEVKMLLYKGGCSFGELSYEREMPDKAFCILPSPQNNPPQTLVSPDIATCSQCLAEIKAEKNRRHRYAFTNCTNCGPRYSIVRGVPYDRPLTSMAEFAMCPECQTEYDTPVNRRFHAQPNACPSCGPHYYLLDAQGKPLEGVSEPIEYTHQLLASGKIVAIKGIGGYHLSCDASNEAAVRQLRQRKHRYAKPLAVMAGSMKMVRRLCNVNSTEEKLLASPVAPIVLLEKKTLPQGILAPSVAPGNAFLGVMLPYAPIHHILLGEDDLLVMTSANLSEEPIVYKNPEAISGLRKIADYLLVHNRTIVHRVDDSVMRIVNGQTQVLRRARGLVPAPLHLPNNTYGARSGEILAMGAYLKSTITVTKDTLAFTSEYIGDLANLATFEAYKEIMGHYQKLFDVSPVHLVCDLHPEYLSTKYARELVTAKQLSLTEVQHHHAHIASVLGEYDCTEPAIGIAFDGTGYGTDDAIWGGEFMLADLKHFRRVAHLEYVPLPGGDKAVKEPWRMALWVLYQYYGSIDAVKENARDFVKRIPSGWEMLLVAAEKGINAPMTSSMGRWFDVVGALLGLCTHNQYEGQAAVMLEQKALEYRQRPSADNEVCKYIENTCSSFWGNAVSGEDNNVIMILPLIAQLLDLSDIAEASYRFHAAIAKLILEVSQQLRQQTGISAVAMSGGVFQNRLLLELTLPLLEKSGFKVMLNKQLPPNDGCISYGQAVVAAARLNS